MNKKRIIFKKKCRSKIDVGLLVIVPYRFQICLWGPLKITPNLLNHLKMIFCCWALNLRISEWQKATERYGRYNAVWPDSAKFRHFRRILKDFGKFKRSLIKYLAKCWTYFGKVLILIVKFSYLSMIRSGHLVTLEPSVATFELRFAFRDYIFWNSSSK